MIEESELETPTKNQEKSPLEKGRNINRNSS
jgi:hypothetical protein